MKPENIFLSSLTKATLADFGQACFVNNVVRMKERVLEPSGNQERGNKPVSHWWPSFKKHEWRSNQLESQSTSLFFLFVFAG